MLSRPGGSDRPVRVAHVNTARDWRGGERQVFNLACSLNEQPAVEQWMVARRGSELASRGRAAGLRVVELPLRGEWDLWSARQLGRLLHSERIDFVHAHTAKAHSIGLFALRHAPATRLIVSRRVDVPMRPGFFSRKKYYSDRIAAYIAISKNVERVLLADGISPEKIRVVYSGIDLEPFAVKKDRSLVEALRRELQLQPNTLVMGNVAALVGHKDQSTLLRSLAALPEDAPPHVLLVLGEGELRAELEALARELGLGAERLRFLGFRENIYDYYRLFDIFVMSSREEGLGTAVLDAMAAGLPVVSTAGGGIPEMIVPESGGLLVPVGDSDALARALGRVLNDASLRAKMANFNREKVKEFSYQATAAGTLDVYREFVGSVT